MSKNMLTSAQLAERLGIKRQSVDRWRLHGQGPEFILINTRVYCEEVAIQRWLDANRHRSTAEYDAPQSGNCFGRDAATA